MEDKFDLEHQYQLYLKRMALNELLMPPQQQIETKRAFFGACGQMLMILQHDLPELSDQEGYEKLEGMIKQVGNYFINQTHKQN